jgi:predicted RNA binding protein YcfA (HicA-like mRNA interferase family)
VKLGWVIKRQHGSHVILTKPGYYESLSIPQHKELSKGTFRGLIRKAGITVEEFVEALKE